MSQSKTWYISKQYINAHTINKNNVIPGVEGVGARHPCTCSLGRSGGPGSVPAAAPGRGGGGGAAEPCRAAHRPGYCAGKRSSGPDGARRPPSQAQSPARGWRLARPSGVLTRAGAALETSGRSSRDERAQLSRRAGHLTGAAPGTDRRGAQRHPAVDGLVYTAGGQPLSVSAGSPRNSPPAGNNGMITTRPRARTHR